MNLIKQGGNHIKDYYKYKITYKVGEVTAKFEEFCNPPA